MVRESIAVELRYFAATFLFGFLVAGCYHLLLFFRALIRHGGSFVDAEDILFFGGVGIAFFRVVYHMNDGILRWYAFFGGFLGVMLYRKTFGALLEPVRKWLLQKQRENIKIRKKRKQEDGESEIEGITSQSKPKKRKEENGSAHHSRRGNGFVRCHRLQQGSLASGEKREGETVS